MSATLRAGDNVLMSDGALIGYPSAPDGLAEDSGESQPQPLFDTGKFLILRGHRVALLGPNGSGKTTFLRTMLGQLAPLAGRVRIGASVRLGYLPQSQDWLDPNKTVLEQLLASGDLKPDQARHLLGRFLFSGDEVLKPISALSGGELSRLALAVLTLRGANFLLLDEPTTHLDVESQEVLQDVLRSYNGTILLVSHDRYLVDALATHVWVIQDGQMRQHEGNYSSYLAELERERAERNGGEDRPAPKARDEQRRLARQAERAARKQAERTATLEAEIQRIEQELATTTGLIDLASSGQDLARLRSLTTEYQRLEATLAERMREWENLASLEASGQ